MKRGLMVCALLIASANLPGFGQSNNEPISDLLHQLKQRQLYRLAEQHCRQQLERDKLSEVARATWVDELILCMARRALGSSNEARTQIWGEIDATVAKLGDELRGLPQAQVRMSHQTVRISHARALLEYALNARSPETLRNEARILFRSAYRELKSLDELLAQQYRQATEPSIKQKYRALRLETRFQTAACDLYSAPLYENGEPDHVRALSQAADRFAELGRTRPASRLTFTSQLYEVKALRQLGQYERAFEQLKASDLPVGDVSLMLLVEIEIAAIRIDSGSALEGVERLATKTQEAANEAEEHILAEARYTLVRGYVKLGHDSREATDRKTWQSLAVDQLKQLERFHEASWLRRAEALVNVQSTGQEASDLELIKRTAANLYRRQDYEQAVVSYQRAAELAMQLSMPEEAFELDFKAAAILYTNKQYELAHAALETLANRQPNHPQASTTHWLAVQAAANRVRESVAELPRYQSTLDAHLAKWPQAETANQARIWRARLHRQAGQHQAAVALLREVTADYQPYTDVLSELRSTYYAWTQSVDSPSPVGKQAAEHFAGLLSNPALQTETSPELNQSLRCQAALSVVEFGALFTDASSTLFAKTVDSNGLAEACKLESPDRYYVLKGLCAALGSDIKLAQASWRQVTWSAQPWVLPLVKRVDRQLERTPSPELATLQRHLIEAIQTRPHYQASSELRGYAARALMHAGKSQDAIVELEALASESPQDATLQVELAEAWEAQGRDEAFKAALECWRRVVRLSPAKSTTWYRGKLGIARTLIATGEVERGLDTIRLLQALHPELGGAETKRQFLELLRSKVGQ